ncbi:hypothetical protein [Brevibacillus sp. HB2.2]|uniref:hypothetical protein n=1 Tax=Brevibacillus sp. HB2.2 TaxID=2738846 RepID=UPI00156A7ABD|nr:hypothetical protein [Brevibacillus sp. HB2.2]NRS50993.1 hypothetical protein [Brevibacillus sp. HB2.2]
MNFPLDRTTHWLINFEIQKLQDYVTRIESFLQSELSELEQAIDLVDKEDDLWDFYYGKIYVMSEEFPTVLRYSVFTQAYSLLEHTLLRYCKLAESELELTISHKDLAGNGIEKFQKYLKKVANISFPDNTESWNAIKGYNIIRNCIAHTLGEVDEMRKAQEITSVLSKMKYIELDHSKIYLGERFCDDVLRNISDFLDRLEENYKERIMLLEASPR